MKKIEKLKNSSFSRGLFAARSAMRMIPALMSGEEDPRKMFADLIGKRIEQFVNEVGELKGSLLKAAQILTLYGEYYLPQEVNEALKKVQSQSHFLGWDRIKNLVPDAHLKKLIIDETPIAAASIGQVHRATHRETQESLVLKIQYPGIKKAIDLDIKMIKSLLSFGKILPRKMNMDGIYGEIRRVLIEEMDYLEEARKHAAYRELMSDVEGVYVPKIYPEFCNDSIIASEFIDGTSFSELPGLNLPQVERDRLGKIFLYLFFKEVFHGSLIQTDCHAGNYLYRNGEMVLIDFGACLHFPETTLSRYRDLIKHVYHQNRSGFFAELKNVSDEIELDEDLLWEYCLMASSPLHSRSFDWAETTLPDDIAPIALRLVKTARIESPPHQFIFLDRKLLGLFSILRMLKCKFDVKDTVDEFMKLPS